MKNSLIILFLSLAVIYSCEKDNVEPISAFTLQGDTISVLKVGTSDEFMATNKSINADSVLWDLGDGRTKKTNSVLISYPKSGTYTLKLTARNNNGETSISTKKIIVLDRVLKRIDFYYAQWDPTIDTEPWPKTNEIDIFFQMQMYTDETYNADGIYPNCPVVYTSPIIKNVRNKFTSFTQPSFVVHVSERIIIEKDLVRFAPGNLNKAYLFSILGKDSAGKMYRITSNAFSGFSFGISKDDISSNSFIATQGGFTVYSLICAFE